MAWSTPVTQTTGTHITAAVWNAQITNNAAYLGNTHAHDGAAGGGSIYALLPQGIILMSMTASVVIEDCEDAWNEYVDADFTVTTPAGMDGNCNKFAIGAGVSEGDRVTEAIASTDLSGYTYVYAWVKCSADLDAGNFKLLLDNSPNCATPLETINIPAIAANVWTYVTLPLANPASDTAIISIGINFNVPGGVCDFYIDDVRVGSGTVCPTGWTRVSAFDGLFVRGAATYGGTGGGGTHTHSHSHTGKLHAHDQNFGDQDQIIDATKIIAATAFSSAGMSQGTAGGSTAYQMASGFLDTTPGGGSDATTGTDLPAYISVIFCKKD